MSQSRNRYRSHNPEAERGRNHDPEAGETLWIRSGSCSPTGIGVEAGATLEEMSRYREDNGKTKKS